jgi:hypothetical protein
MSAGRCCPPSAQHASLLRAGRGRREGHGAGCAPERSAQRCSPRSPCRVRAQATKSSATSAWRSRLPALRARSTARASSAWGIRARPRRAPRAQNARCAARAAPHNSLSSPRRTLCGARPAADLPLPSHPLRPTQVIIANAPDYLFSAAAYCAGSPCGAAAGPSTAATAAPSLTGFDATDAPPAPAQIATLAVDGELGAGAGAGAGAACGDAGCGAGLVCVRTRGGGGTACEAPPRGVGHGGYCCAGAGGTGCSRAVFDVARGVPGICGAGMRCDWAILSCVRVKW